MTVSHHLAAVTALLCLVAPLQAQKPIYELKFVGGTLENTGTIGGEAVEIAAQHGSSQFEVVKDADLGAWVARFPTGTNGQQGPALELPESTAKLRLENPVGAMTIALWLRWNGPDRHQDPRQFLVEKLNVLQDSGWGFSIQEDGSLRFDWITAAEGSNRVSTECLPQAEWTHVAMTWDNQDKNGLKIFINGVKAGLSLEHTGGGPLRPNDEPALVGATVQNYLSLNGDIADLHIFNRVLEAEEIQAIFDSKAK